ncbi:MAG: DUF5049 domain-containing protein [Lachnospiraceae bacterium]|nr:DUF5049 domain-containing protein [Lachnospiraceae bacterium]
MTEQIKEQILFIRDTGLTNMFDLGMVRALAREFDMPELVEFIDSDSKVYTNFILTGETK